MITVILFPVIFISVVGLASGAILSIASVVMAVPVDEKQVALREALPGANCGACGYAGCDGYAEALADGSCGDVTLCSPGGDGAKAQIAGILGVEAADTRKMSAFVQCAGSCDKTSEKMQYFGEITCTYASQLYGGPASCSYGCLGFGDCVGVCEYDAVQVVNGVATVNPALCAGCKKCVAICPKGIIAMAPANKSALVSCSSRDKGAEAKKLCTVSCIGCNKCAKGCEEGAIKVENFLARVDYDKCTACGVCAKECPQKSIQMA